MRGLCRAVKRSRFGPSHHTASGVGDAVMCFPWCIETGAPTCFRTRLPSGGAGLTLLQGRSGRLLSYATSFEKWSLGCHCSKPRFPGSRRLRLACALIRERIVASVSHF